MAPSEQIRNYRTFSSGSIYDAVVVACCGGILLRLPESESDVISPDEMVHPGFLFSALIPLIVCQSSAIMFLFLETDVSEPVRDPHTTTDLIFTSKMLVVGIVQVTMFAKLFQSMRFSLFVLNPVTWIDVRRPCEGYKWKLYLTYPFAVIAVLMKLLVVYVVTVTSVSIVLACRDVEDALFDSLALVFIADLDTNFWDLYSSIIHLTPQDGFAFRLVDPELQTLGQTCLAWLRTGYVVERFELICTFVLLSLLYMRQFLVVLFALDTNMLPVARDICGMTDCPHPLHSLHCLTVTVVQHFTIIDLQSELEKAASYCDASAMPLKTWQMFQLAWQHGKTIFWCSLILVTLTAPQVALVITRARSSGNRYQALSAQEYQRKCASLDST